MAAKKKTRRSPGDRPAQKESAYGREGEKPICVNTKCKLMKQGCKGFIGCPGYKAR